jgi:hypothetical protein
VSNTLCNATEITNSHLESPTPTHLKNCDGLDRRIGAARGALAMTFTPFFIIALPVIVLFTMGLIGSTRRAGFWLTLGLSVLLTPIGGFLVAWLSGPRAYTPPKPRPPRAAA